RAPVRVRGEAPRRDQGPAPRAACRDGRLAVPATLPPRSWNAGVGGRKQSRPSSTVGKDQMTRAKIALLSVAALGLGAVTTTGAIAASGKATATTTIKAVTSLPGFKANRYVQDN